MKKKERKLEAKQSLSVSAPHICKAKITQIIWSWQYAVLRTVTMIS